MCSITEVLRRFKQNWIEELSPQAIAQACRDVGMQWYESALNPVVAVQIFFVQVLHGNTACEHLPHLTGLSFTAAAYCKARMRVNLEALHLLLVRCVEGLQRETFDAARWLGHRVFHVDGSSFSMPDTRELQAHFGQPGQQQPGYGFPTAHWLVLLHAGTGMITKMLAAPLRTHDMAGGARTASGIARRRRPGRGSRLLLLCPFSPLIAARSACSAAHPSADDRRFHAGQNARAPLPRES